MSDAPLTLQALQDHIRERYLETDRARGAAATFVWWIEEVGELASAIQKGDRANLAEEFADVLAWLCTLANVLDVDLETAVRRKYLEGGGPTGHK